MLTVTDVDAIMLEGLDKLEEWEREFQSNFNSPLVQAALVKGLLELGPGAALGYKEKQPKKFEQLNRQIGRMQRI